MKNNRHKIPGSTVPVCLYPIPLELRYRIVVEFPEGVCESVFASGSEEEILEAFFTQIPLVAGGAIGIYDYCEDGFTAWVKWRMRTTELGLRVMQRENVFCDWPLGLLALRLPLYGKVDTVIKLSA